MLITKGQFNTRSIKRLSCVIIRMKAIVLLLFILGALPSIVVAKNANQKLEADMNLAKPAKNAYIVRFYANSAGESPKTEKNSGPGPLHIIYSDETQVDIPNERGRFEIGERTLTQENFSDIQLADDRQHLGWLADYMICQQSYPCSAELVIYQSGHKFRYIDPPYGILWKWRFLNSGKQVVVQFGFPHGDSTEAYALYDADTGDLLAKFIPSAKNKAPHWVQQLESSSK